MGFLSRVVLGLGHSFDVRLRAGEQEEGPFAFPDEETETQRARVTCKAFPSSQGEGGGRASRITVTRLSLPPTKASVFSCSIWPCNDFKVLLVIAPNSPPQSVLETLRREGRGLYLSASGRSPWQAPPSGLNSPSCTQGTRKGESSSLASKGHCRRRGQVGL